MKVKYVCEICEREFDTADEALECEGQGYEKPIVEVGDFVSISWNDRYGRFHWFDGCAEWTRKMPEGLHSKEDWDCDYYDLIYVVTAITYENCRGHCGHEAKYHLETKAMTSERKGWRGGWTYPHTHYTPHKIEVEGLDGSDLIGHTFEYML